MMHTQEKYILYVFFVYVTGKVCNAIQYLGILYNVELALVN